MLPTTSAAQLTTPMASDIINWIAGVDTPVIVATLQYAFFVSHSADTGYDVFEPSGLPTPSSIKSAPMVEDLDKAAIWNISVDDWSLLSISYLLNRDVRTLGRVSRAPRSLITTTLGYMSRLISIIAELQTTRSVRLRHLAFLQSRYLITCCAVPDDWGRMRIANSRSSPILTLKEKKFALV